MSNPHKVHKNEPKGKPGTQLFRYTRCALLNGMYYKEKVYFKYGAEEEELPHAHAWKDVTCKNCLRTRKKR
jgi:hypothetical protein